MSLDVTGRFVSACGSVQCGRETVRGSLVRKGRGIFSTKMPTMLRLTKTAGILAYSRF